MGHVAHIGEMKSFYRVLFRRPEGRDHLASPGIDKWMVLRYVIKEKC